MVAPNEKIQDLCVVRYQNQSATFYLTNGLVYTDTTVLADITALPAADRNAKSETLGTCVSGEFTQSVVHTNSDPTTFVFTGAAMVLDGRGVIEDYTNDLSNVIAASGGTFTVEWNISGGC